MFYEKIMRDACGSDRTGSNSDRREVLTRFLEWVEMSGRLFDPGVLVIAA
jgi:hypothetical protein